MKSFTVLNEFNDSAFDMLANKQIKNESALIYIHGGPIFDVRSAEDDCLLYLFTFKGDIIVPNYRGNYRVCKELPESSLNGGIRDLAQVKAVVEHALLIYERVFIVGDSYGGYLASLLAGMKGIEHIYVTSGFISIKYENVFV